MFVDYIMQCQLNIFCIKNHCQNSKTNQPFYGLFIFSPTQIPILGKQLDTVADLLNSGATVSTNILIIAIKSEYLDMIKLLLRHVIRGSDSYTDTLIVCLMFTVKNSDISVVRYFIDAGAPLNPTPDWPLLRYSGHPDEYSPLCEACKRGNVDIVRLLLDNGATPNLDIDREPPLNAAVRFRHIRVVELLLSRGVDVNAGKQGFCKYTSALCCACTDDQLDMVKLLLHHGAKINIDNTGFLLYTSPLVVAAKKRHQAVVELLLHHGAHINFEDPHAHAHQLMYRRFRPDGEVWVDRSAVPANSQSILDDRGVIMAVALCRFYYGRSRSVVYEREIIDGRVLFSICLCVELESVTTEWMRLYHYYQSN